MSKDRVDLDYSLDLCPYCRKRIDSPAPDDCPDPGGHRAGEA